MDLRFTAEEAAFRDEMRGFFRSALTPELRRRFSTGTHSEKSAMVDWVRILHDRGWSVPHWPVEWGGTGWDPVRQYIFQDEMQQAGAPQVVPFGASMLGPVLIQFGSQAQKHRFLPRIARLEDWWCQGFSEPGAGSDLASLTTSARLEGDHYIVNGQKTWTTLGQYADWIFCLVRTDVRARKQQGITFVLVDMKTPGVTVRPIQTIDGGHEINEVFFDDVRVPVENRVGEENRGWDYAKFLLGNERTSIARIGSSKHRLRKIRQMAAITLDQGRPFLENRRFAEKLCALEVELKALEMTQLRVVAGETRHPSGQPDPASSILKIKGSEIQQATTELLLEVIGPWAMPRLPEPGAGSNEPQPGPGWAALVAPDYFNMRKVSIYGGSNEIQKSIIAKAILGL